jgi:hypothetical protein
LKLRLSPLPPEVLANVSEPKPLEVSFSINEVKLTFRAEEVDRRNGEIVYELSPEVPGDDGTCEVCHKDATAYCLIDGSVKSRCDTHSKGIAVTPGLLRSPESPTLEDLLVRPISAEATEGQKVHRLTEKLRDEGLSWKVVSKQLESIGFSGVAVRTLQKHMAKECSCFPGEH